MSGLLAQGEQPTDLLERWDELTVLFVSLAAVLASRRGRLVLIRGEAGVGKTALIRAFCDRQRGASRILAGACTPLFTPRPLGPFLDVAQVTGGELEELVSLGARPHEVAVSLARELARDGPTILTLEDLHWADEATLDVLRLLARRVETLSTLVVASYRDDELPRTHPLRILLGELATEGVIERLKIEPLSPEAVANLAEPRGVDAGELYDKTSGNPFFVTEVLAAGGDDIPATVRDAVLARVARLDPGARAFLESASVLPQRSELWLLEAVAGDAIEHLEECLSSGILTSLPQGVGFRHELARLAVEDSLPPNRRLVLHRKALHALAAPPGGGSPDVVRLAHHAEAAGEAEAVLRFAPAAALRANSLGAHREAAAHYGRALRFASGVPRDELAGLLELRAHECYLADQSTAAIDALEQAISHRRDLHDTVREGDGRRLLAQILWSAGQTDRAEEAAREAVKLLEGQPAGRELAMAYSVLASRYMNADDFPQSLAWGGRGHRLAEELGQDDIVAHALNTIGTTRLLMGEPAGRRDVLQSRELAERVGSHEQVARAFTNEAWADVRSRTYDSINRQIHPWLQYCEENGLDLWRLHLLAYWSQAELDQGRWTAAADAAAVVLRAPRSSALPRIIALVVLGLVRARRGDPGVWSCLDEALGLIQPTQELQRMAPVAAARAEAFWLEGAHEAIVEATEAALSLAIRRRANWFTGDLMVWRWRAGVREAPPELAEPYDLQLAGEWRRASERWSARGCHYEAALALGDADDDDALRRSLEDLLHLGGRPAAAIVTRRLRERGARRLPRGPRATTRRNLAGLTSRELDVLRLIMLDLPNAEIARRLFLAEKTVDHHVSAILRKLAVSTRRQARTKAAQLGLAGKDR